MIQIYTVENTDFSQNGDMTLLPLSAEIHVILNGSWEATLTHPIDSTGRWKYIEENAVIKMPSFLADEQLFRIRNRLVSDSGVTATMEPIFYDSMGDCFLTDVRPTAKNGQQALDIMTAPNGKYSGSSDITRASTAYYVYKNLMEAINGDDENSFINRWGGEILFDNFTVIINDEVGGDYGVELRYGKNIPADGLTEEVDITEVVTRIYPTSYNGYEMTNHGYVDSDLINNYPTVKAKTIQFSDVKMRADASEDDEENGIIICDTQAELDAALTEKCEAEFSAGLDKPKVTINADMVLLQNTEQYKDYRVLETVSLGDTIHCHHTKLDINTEARVIELTYDAILGKVTAVVLGDFEYNYFNNVSSSVNRIDGAIRPDGSVVAEQIQGFINGAKSQLRLQNTIAEKQDVRAILFEDLDEASPTFGAMALGTQGLQISRQRTTDGRDWDWTTALTSEGLIASIIVAGILSDQTGNNYWNLDTGEFRLASTATVGGETIATQNQTIKGVDVEYASGTSNTTAPTSGWSTDAPAWQQGRYIWQRTVTTMADGRKNISDPTCIQGAEGETGVGVTNIIEQYYLSTSSTTQKGGSWSTAQPEWQKGKYIWTRSVVTWSNGTTTNTDPILAKAINGANEAVDDLDTELDQEGVFNRLTNNGQVQGIYLQDGKLYLNGEYMQIGKIADHDGESYWDLDSGELNFSGTFNMTDGQVNISTDNDNNLILLDGIGTGNEAVRCRISPGQVSVSNLEQRITCMMQGHGIYVNKDVNADGSGGTTIFVAEKSGIGVHGNDDTVFTAGQSGVWMGKIPTIVGGYTGRFGPVGGYYFTFKNGICTSIAN